MVVGVCGIDGEMQVAGQLLVGARVAERLSAGDGATAENVQVSNGHALLRQRQQIEDGFGEKG